MPKLTWDSMVCMYAATADGHYRILETPPGPRTGTHRFLAIRERYDAKGRQWEYAVGHFRSMDLAMTACQEDLNLGS